MLKKLSAFSFILGLFASSAFAAEGFIGQYVYQYEGGVSYRVSVPNEKEIRWECIEGAEKGAKGEETPDRHKVAEGIYFLSWVEKTGISVTQVVDLNQSKVYSTVIEGKDRFVLVGKVRKEN